MMRFIFLKLLVLVGCIPQQFAFSPIISFEMPLPKLTKSDVLQVKIMDVTTTES